MTQTDRGRQRVCAIDWQLISNFNPKQFRCWDFDSTKNTTQHSTFTDSIEGCEIVIPQQARRSNDFIRVWQPSQLLQLKCQINANITKHKHTHTHSHKDHVTHECGVLAPSDVDALWCFFLFRFRLSVLVLNDKMMNSYWATFAPPKPKSNPYLVSSLFYSIAVVVVVVAAVGKFNGCIFMMKLHQNIYHQRILLSVFLIPFFVRLRFCLLFVLSNFVRIEWQKIINLLLFWIAKKENERHISITSFTFSSRQNFKHFCHTAFYGFSDIYDGSVIWMLFHQVVPLLMRSH